MPLVDTVRSSLRRLFGRFLVDAKKIDEVKRDPRHAYTGRDVNVERDFRKPRP